MRINEHLAARLGIASLTSWKWHDAPGGIAYYCERTCFAIRSHPKAITIMTSEAATPGPWKRLVRYFVAGVFTVLPALLTIVAISWGINFLAELVGPDTFLGSKLSNIGLHYATNPTVAYAIGWLGLAIVVFIVGFLVESGMRGIIHRLTDAIIRRVPLVGKVYETSQQLVNMLDTGGGDNLKGMSVVYCKFGSEDAVGVLALLPKQETTKIDGHDHYVVLVPQSPVPIGGGLLFMPADSVKRVGMSVDTLMSIYMSMGVVAPSVMPEARRKPSLPE